MPDAVFAIPARVRTAILRTLTDWGANPGTVVSEIGKRRGFASVGDLVEFIGETYGGDARSEYVARAAEAFSQRHGPGYGLPHHVQLRDSPLESLVAIPDALFIEAAEMGRQYAGALQANVIGDGDRTFHEYQSRVSELFLANGVPYEFNDEGELVPSGSATAYVASVGPAIDVLNDPRLATAREHFIEAQRRLREPDPDEAVDEGRQAVEAAMLAVLAAHNIATPGSRQPANLFDALVSGAVLTTDAKELVLATPFFRGRTAAGHVGGAAVTVGEAQAAVAATAASVLYLADKLP